MNIQLTPEEEKIIKRIEVAGSSSDYLLQDLSLLVPCFFIVGMGAWFSQRAVVVAGALIYCIFHIAILLSQGKGREHLRSAIEKLRKAA